MAKFLINSYETARSVLEGRTARELGSRTHLVRRDDESYAVEVLQTSGWTGGIHWYPVVVYEPGGRIYINQGDTVDMLWPVRINQYSPVLLVVLNHWDNFFRWQNKDYYFHHAVHVQAGKHSRPRYAVSDPPPAFTIGDKRLHPGRPCVLADDWRRGEMDRQEARKLLERLEQLVLKCDLLDLFGDQLRRIFRKTLEEELHYQEAKTALERELALRKQAAELCKQTGSHRAARVINLDKPNHVP